MPSFGLKGPKVDLDMPEVTELSADLPDADINTKLPDMSVDVKVPTVEVNIPNVSLEGKAREINLPSYSVDVNVPSVNIPSVEIPKGEIDIKAPKVKGDVRLDAKLPELSIKGKAPKAPKVKVKAPKVPPVTLKASSVPDVSFKSSIDAPDASMHMKIPDTSFDMPDASVKAKSGFGIKLPGFLKKSKKFEINAPGKIPELHVKGELPSVSAHGEIPDVQISHELPSASIHANVPRASIDLPKVDIRTPDMPSISVKTGSMPDVSFSGPQLSLPGVSVDTSLDTDMSLQGNLPELELGDKSLEMPNVKPKVDVKAGKKGFKLPKFGGKVKAPKADINVEVPTVDIKGSVPSLDADIKGSVASMGADIKGSAPSFGADFKGTLPSLKTNIHGSIPNIEAEVKAPKINVDLPEVNVSQIHAEAPEMSASTPSILVDFPNISIPDVTFDAPSMDIPTEELPNIAMSGVKSPMKFRAHVKSPQIPGSIPDVSLKTNTPTVSFQTPSMPTLDADLSGVSISQPELSTSISSGKVKVNAGQLPSVKLDGRSSELSTNLPEVAGELQVAGSIPKGSIVGQVPSADASISGDVSLPSVDIKGGKVKMPKIKSKNAKSPEPSVQAGLAGELEIDAPDVDLAGGSVSVKKDDGKEHKAGFMQSLRDFKDKVTHKFQDSSSSSDDEEGDDKGKKVKEGKKVKKTKEEKSKEKEEKSKEKEEKLKIKAEKKAKVKKDKIKKKNSISSASKEDLASSSSDESEAEDSLDSRVNVKADVKLPEASSLVKIVDSSKKSPKDEEKPVIRFPQVDAEWMEEIESIVTAPGNQQLTVKSKPQVAPRRSKSKEPEPADAKQQKKTKKDKRASSSSSSSSDTDGDDTKDKSRKPKRSIKRKAPIPPKVTSIEVINSPRDEDVPDDIADTSENGRRSVSVGDLSRLHIKSNGQPLERTVSVDIATDGATSPNASNIPVLPPFEDLSVMYDASSAAIPHYKTRDSLHSLTPSSSSVETLKASPTSVIHVSPRESVTIVTENVSIDAHQRSSDIQKMMQETLDMMGSIVHQMDAPGYEGKASQVTISTSGSSVLDQGEVEKVAQEAVEEILSAAQTRQSGGVSVITYTVDTEPTRSVTHQGSNVQVTIPDKRIEVSQGESSIVRVTTTQQTSNVTVMNVKGTDASYGDQALGFRMKPDDEVSAEANKRLLRVDSKTRLMQTVADAHDIKISPVNAPLRKDSSSSDSTGSSAGTSPTIRSDTRPPLFNESSRTPQSTQIQLNNQTIEITSTELDGIMMSHSDFLAKQAAMMALRESEPKSYDNWVYVDHKDTHSQSSTDPSSNDDEDISYSRNGALSPTTFKMETEYETSELRVTSSPIMQDESMTTTVYSTTMTLPQKTVTQIVLGQDPVGGQTISIVDSSSPNQVIVSKITLDAASAEDRNKDDHSLPKLETLKK
ncbi:unnamed protein product [Allacma fusca]|uniref:Uncharacterized protein n=1 Tax=Allacma fusca TaxID=39272 RepID=A0A8J2M8A7_9HEXA|nr:unnamed protein product [Allacma fusca]